MSAPVVHFEIIGKDAAKLQSFYADLFDWKIDANNPMNYGMCAPNGHGTDSSLSLRMTRSVVKSPVC